MSAFKKVIVSLLSFSAVLVLAGSLWGELVSSHLDELRVPRGCAACHRGRGSAGTPLLKSGKEEFCYRCHGGINRAEARTDIESVFVKSSVHPIYETGHYHSIGEELPETMSTVPRHASCYDCHVTHLSNPEVPWNGARGYSPGAVRGRNIGGTPPGLRLNRADNEYEVCYMCHSDSANLPFESRNIAEEFDPANASYHPVEFEGRNKNVPSLVTQLSVNSRMRCGDCHGNSDIAGPRGPHGSDYEPLLIAQYITEEGVESPKQYELCYICHDRRSILGDESFRKHSSHLLIVSASCHTCHASHGSKLNTNLISFDDKVVSPTVSGIGPFYSPGVPGMPRCDLNCHGVDHNSIDIGGRPWPW